MKNKFILLSLTIVGFVFNATAQIQANKQLQMIGATDNDRRITGVGNASDTADVVNVSSIQQSRLTYAVSSSNGNAYNVALPVSPGVYAAGMILSFKATIANTGAITLNINNLGAKAVYKNVRESLIANDIVADQVVSVIYDGSSFQIISQLKPASGFTGSLSGDVKGTQLATLISNGAVTTDKIKDNSVTDAKLAPGIAYSKLTGVPTSLPPSGIAGGDLAGTYPNPTLSNGAISTTKISDGAITDQKIAYGISYSKLTGAPTSLPPNGTAGGDLTGSYPNPFIANNVISTAKIAKGAVTMDKLNATGAITGQVLSYNGTNVEWTTKSISGPAGGDLSGKYPNPGIATGAVTSSKIADGAITDTHINAAANIAYAKLNLSNSIVSADIANDAITSSKIANGAVTNAKISAAGAANGQVLAFNGTNVSWSTLSTTPTGAAGGDLTGIYPNPTLGSSVVTSDKIADGTIVNADISSTAAIAYSKLKLTNGIVSSDITNSAVTSGKISDGAVSTAKIMDGAVTDAKIADGISYNKLIGVPTSLAPEGAAGGDLSGTYPNPGIATNAITSVKIKDGAIVTNKLIDAAVTTDKLNDGAVTPAKINAANATSGQVLTYDGMNITWATPTGGSGVALQYNGIINNAVTYAANASSVVNYNNAITNASRQMNTSTGTFTAAGSGLYHFDASLPASANGVRFLALRVNGVDVFTGSAGTGIAATSPYNATITSSSLSVTYPLNANDQVQVYIYTNASVATPLTNGSARLLITKLN